MTRREAEAVEAERDRLREALTWAVGFIRCNLPKTSAEYPDMRNAEDLVAGRLGKMHGEFQMSLIRAELAESVAEAAVSGLGLKKEHATPTDVKEVIAGLQAEAELYRRGFHLIGACDTGNYLARCAHGGETMEI